MNKPGWRLRLSSPERMMNQSNYMIVRLVALLSLVTWIALAAVETKTLEILVERKSGDAWAAVDPQTVLDTGDLIRFRAAADLAGFLYITNESSSGETALVFPLAGAENWLEKEQEIQVPAGESYFRISGPAGFDVLYWVFSPVKLSPAEGGKAQPPADARPEKPLDLRPRCDDEIWRTRGDCIDKSAGVRPAAPDRKQKVLAEFFGASGERTRELKLKPGDTPARLESAGAGSGPVVFEFRMAHR